jgi:hypothetical protein
MLNVFEITLLKILIPSFFLKSFYDLPDGFLLLLVHDQRGILGMDDDHVIQANRDDQVIFFGTNNRVAGFDSQVFSQDYVALGIRCMHRG